MTGMRGRWLAEWRHRRQSAPDTARESTARKNAASPAAVTTPQNRQPAIQARRVLTALLLTALALTVLVVTTSDAALLRDPYRLLSSLYLIGPAVLVYFHVLGLGCLRGLNQASPAMPPATAAAIALSGAAHPSKDAPPLPAPLRILGWTVTAALPVAILLAVQIRFVPMQNPWITRWHQILLAIQVAVLVWEHLQNGYRLVPAPHLPTGKRPQPRYRAIPAHTGIVLILAAGLLGFSWNAAHRPGPAAGLVRLATVNETFDGCIRDWPRNAATGTCGSLRLLTAIWPETMPNRDLLRAVWALGGNSLDRWLCPKTNGTFGCRYLALPGRDFASKSAPPLRLQNRTLRHADFSDARLSGIDFRGADLNAARLSGAALQKAHFIAANLDRADLTNAKMAAADLRRASLRHGKLGKIRAANADLRQANLKHANLAQARLENVALDKADLAGANLLMARLSHAKMRGAILTHARLESAWLPNAGLTAARLQGANLANARLPGATLTKARLAGAKLRGARLQSADLTDAALQGADFGFAWLQGAQLLRARLQGADLGFAWLQGARLDESALHGANLWNTWLRGASLDRARLDGAHVIGSDFTAATLQGAHLAKTLWRDNRLRHADLRGARRKPANGRNGGDQTAIRAALAAIETWTGQDRHNQNTRTRLQALLPEGAAHLGTLASTSQRLPAPGPAVPVLHEGPSPASAFAHWSGNPTPAMFAAGLRRDLMALACGDSHVARGLAAQFAAPGPQSRLSRQGQNIAGEAVTALRNIANRPDRRPKCAPLHDLPADMKRRLREAAGERGNGA